MKLILSQPELETAIRNYVTSMIVLAEGTDIEIEFKAGRGENGISAEIDINYLSVRGLPDAVDQTKTDTKDSNQDADTSTEMPTETAPSTGKRSYTRRASAPNPLPAPIAAAGEVADASDEGKTEIAEDTGEDAAPPPPTETAGPTRKSLFNQ